MSSSVTGFPLRELTRGVRKFLKRLLLVVLFLTCFTVVFVISYFSLFDPAPTAYKGLGPIDMRFDIVVPRPGEAVTPEWSTIPLTPTWVVPVSLLLAAAVALGLAWVFHVTLAEIIPNCFDSLRWLCGRGVRFLKFQRDLYLLWDTLAPEPHREKWWERNDD